MTENKQSIPTGAGDVYLEGQTAIIEDTVTSPMTPSEFNSSDIEFTLAPYAGADPVVHKTDSSPHVNVIDRDNGILEVKVAHHETDGLGMPEGEEYHYEILLRTPTDDRAYVSTGTWTIHSSSTPIP